MAKQWWRLSNLVVRAGVLIVLAACDSKEENQLAEAEVEVPADTLGGDPAEIRYLHYAMQVHVEPRSYSRVVSRLAEGDSVLVRVSDHHFAAVLASDSDTVGYVLKGALRSQPYTDAMRRRQEAQRREYVSLAPPAVAWGGTQQAWYRGGTLHRATMAEWNRAPYENRLATSADFASQILKPRTTEAIRGPAHDMMQCISRAAQAAPPSKQVSELGAVCAALLGW